VNGKKIVWVANSSWSIFNFRLALLKFLKSKGFEVYAIAPRDSYSEKIESAGVTFYDWPIENSSTNPIKDAKQILNLYKLYQKIRPEVVLHSAIKPNIYGTLVARALHQRCINNISGLGTIFSSQGILNKIARFLYKISQPSASKVFFQNSMDRDLFINSKILKPTSPIDLLPGSGVDTNRFKPGSKQRADNKFIFLMMGRILWDKGIGEYIEAAKTIKAQYANTEFQLLGFTDADNPSAVSRAQVEQWHQSGIIKYLGTSDKVEEIIEDADCVVLPTYYQEGVPRCLLESAAMAKPLIATNWVGCRDVVDDGVNGYLCEVKNPASLASQMKKMLDLERKARENMGLAGRQKIEKYFDERIVFEKYYEAICDLT
jgi:glycosyltransferase involved in cell wall biosynthesis